MPKLIPHEVILVSSIPNCFFCEQEGNTTGVPGPYDFATRMGPWANGCERHWVAYRAASTLGTGKGQLWVTEDQVTEEVEVKAEEYGLAFDAASHPDNLYDAEGKIK